MNVEQALLAHFQYMERVVSFVEDAGPEPELVDPHECQVGRWLKLYPNPEIEDLHAQFHKILADAVKKKKFGEKKDAKALIDEAYILFNKIEHTLFG